MEEDEGDVRVTVDPSASHYHAGENATFTISFTNTRATPTQTPRPAMPRAISDGQAGAYARSRGHRRAVSSVSEARMARPPTSPGLRRPTPPVPPKYSPSASTSSSTSPKASRQGLIGQRRLGNGNRMHPLRSLSVAITSHSAFHELVDAQDEHDGVVALNGSGTPTTPTHPSPSPPRRSRTTTGIPLSHPHARKQSAALDGVFPTTSSLLQRLPSTPSISTFSMSLAPITESNSFDSFIPSPLGPGGDLRTSLGHGRNSSRYTHELSVQAPTPPQSTPTPSNSQFYPDTPSTPSPTHTEASALILLAHAQLTGTLTLEPPSAALAATWRAAEAGTGRRVVGGGRVGIGAPRPRARPRAASGVGAWLGLASSGSDGGVRASMGLGGLVSAGSSTASLASAPPDSPSTRPLSGRRGHQRATSMASFIPGMASISALLSPFGEDEPGESGVGGARGGMNGMGAMNGSAALDSMGSSATVEEGVYPILETQPSVLAVDLTLQPGETRKYTYTITLPSALPPSFRGKYFRLTYHLVVGTTRPDAHSDVGQLRRVIRVPIRMYNHVAVGRAPRPYDLMWPLAKRREGAMLVGRVEEGKTIGLGLGELEKGFISSTALKSPEKGKITRKELEIYAGRLVASVPDPLAAGISKLQLSAPNGLGPNTYEDDEGANMSCRDAVEVVTRHSKKVSYDIAKDGRTVAVITFVKATYRLGETLLGAIEFNNPEMEGRVLKYSATLESTESLALHTPAPQTRKHAEHHAALALGAQRAAFSLDIPSDGTPSFSLMATEMSSLTNSSAGSLNGRSAPPNGYAVNGVTKSKTALEGGLQWRVRVALVVCMSARTRHVVRDGLGNEWGEAWRAGELAPVGPVSSSSAVASGGGGWSAFFGGWTGEEEPTEGGVKEDEEDKWVKLKLETLECELPITVFPGSTAYQPNGFDTWA